MTNDTLKSLGYLKKSLKMTKRAMEKNNDGNVVTETAINDFIKLIGVWEAAVIPVTDPVGVSPTAINPTPPPSTTDDGSDDLLTT